MMKNQGIINNQNQYDEIIELRTCEIFADFKKNHDALKHKELFKNGYLSDLRKKYESIENDKNFFGVLSGIREIEVLAKEGETYFDSILKYQKQSKRTLKEIVDYLIEYNTVIGARPKIEEYCLKNETALKQNFTEQERRRYVINTTFIFRQLQYHYFKYFDREYLLDIVQEKFINILQGSQGDEYDVKDEFVLLEEKNYYAEKEDVKNSLAHIAASCR
jgi:hypothetical protein